MRGKSILAAGLVAITCVLASANNSFADWQNPTGVCKDSRGCGSDTGNGGNSYSRSGSSPPWGGATADTMESAKKCRDFFCALGHIAISLPISLLMDAPYYAGKGVGYGLYYGGKGLGKGLYYGGRGLGQGLAYTGRAIGRGIAYPFNRPPKPILPPTTWEQYKHDVLRHQKRLAKANKANKENQRWCAKNVPLEISPNRARWEGLCNAGDAVSRAALPPDSAAAALAAAPAEASAVAVIPDVAAAVVAAPTATTEKAPTASGENETSTPPPAKLAEGDAATPITSAPPAGAPIPTPTQPPSGDSTAPGPPTDAPQNPDASQQQAVQTGVAPDKAGLNEAQIAGTSPSMLAQGKPPPPLLAATPANILTPSEYGFEGRGGYAVRYDHIWGTASSADLFIEKWNILQPLSSLQATIRNTLYDKGTEHAKTTLWDKAKEIASDLLKRVHGSAAIVDRAASTMDGIIKVKDYPMDLIGHDIALINAATVENIEQVDAASNAQMAEGYKDLEHTTVETVMGQVGDPMEKVKDYTLEKTNESLPMAAPKNKPLQESTIHYWVEGLGLGDSKAKVIH